MVGQVDCDDAVVCLPTGCGICAVGGVSIYTRGSAATLGVATLGSVTVVRVVSDCGVGVTLGGAGGCMRGIILGDNGGSSRIGVLVGAAALNISDNLRSARIWSLPSDG